MNCPKCRTVLKRDEYQGIEIDKCPNCGGMWFDADELDDLEDQAFSVDNLKGSLIHYAVETNWPCPHCGKFLKKFQYRLYSLELEYCESGDGFWLDAGEAERVLEIMAQREKDMERKFKAEAEWRKTLDQFRRKSFWDRLRGLFQ